ncbi:hypothetical protein [Gimesia algae]|uniref:Glycosyltransferase RgtA/B/C/D-like domain-containing protein n=1 Tax=Gimesia algae TaxID=2527971 RepID=A0A517V8P1_9PLAN|nr:hypothetical protein [Gimesia algae]QDT89381.1 hypothetical protein Pan161_10100 [Gimesia algae]
MEIQAAKRVTVYTWIAVIVFTLFLMLCVPLFIRMPLATDVVLYDLQAQTALSGGTLYQDVFETNLPGIVWLHMLVRPLVGMSSDALRVVDLLILGGSILLLMFWNCRNQFSITAMLWMGITLFAFYFSLTEWCHFQRDTLILFPALVALWLRRKQTDRILEAESLSHKTSVLVVWGWGFLEGLCWATAFWIKPFVAVPALCVWIGSLFLIRQPRKMLIDFSGLLLGGLTLGAIGITWLWQTGAWPWFYETFTEWNPEYVAARKAGWNPLRFAQFLFRFYPWCLLHLIAVPLSFSTVWQCWKIHKQSKSTLETGQRDTLLLSLMYLGWLFQSYAFQHLFDYVHPPSHLLAIAVIGVYLGSRAQAQSLNLAWKMGVFLFTVMAVLSFPNFKPERIQLWPTCVLNQSNLQLKSELALMVQVDWDDLAAVKAFLEKQNLKDRELHCYNSTLVYLYPELAVEPATRYVFFDSILIFCPKHRRELMESVKTSPQKLIVTDLLESGFDRKTALAKSPNSNQLTPPAYPVSLKGAYPWSQPVVFRAGRYLVHQVQRPLGRFPASGYIPTEEQVREIARQQK